MATIIEISREHHTVAVKAIPKAAIGGGKFPAGTDPTFRAWMDNYLRTKSIHGDENGQITRLILAAELLNVPGLPLYWVFEKFEEYLNSATLLSDEARYTTALIILTNPLTRDLNVQGMLRTAGIIDRMFIDIRDVKLPVHRFKTIQEYNTEMKAIKT